MNNKIIVLMVFSFAVSCAHADIYKYTDENGNVTFTLTPIKGAVRIMSESQPTQDDDIPSEWLETPIKNLRVLSRVVSSKSRGEGKTIEAWIKVGNGAPKIQFFDCLHIGVGNTRNKINRAVPDTDNYRLAEYVCSLFKKNNKTTTS
jgi:hypothetical protein